MGKTREGLASIKGESDHEGVDSQRQKDSGSG
jgi:hypothetical protein